MANLDLEKRQRERLESCLDEIASDWGVSPAPSLEDLVSKWRAFVVSVETGFAMTIYDYTHLLSVRDDLEAVLKTVGKGTIAEHLRSALRPLDDRFRLATVKSDRSSVLRASGEESGHWWHRIPRRLQGELAKDLSEPGS